MQSKHYDVEAIRREFPVTKHMLYLDSAHQTPLATSVREALMRFYDEGHESGGPKAVWLRRVDQVRERLAAFIGADPTEIAFTKNTSEGLNIAANALPLGAGDVVLMVEGDHPNNACAFMNLRRKGVEVRFVPLTGETADASTFEAHIDANIRAISLSHVTFHAGERFDVSGIGKLCAEKGLHFVVDSMQSIGIVPLDVKEVGATFLASGTHKGMLVPQGLGILYCKGDAAGMEPAYMAMSSLANPPADYIARHENTALRPGAGRFEIGNFNLPDIHGLAASLDLIERVGVANLEAHFYDLGDRLIEHLDHQGIQLVGPRTRSARAPHIYVLDLQGKDWLDYFANQNVRVSPERDGIRVSFGMFNTLDEIDQVADIIKRRHKTGAGLAPAAELVD